MKDNLKIYTDENINTALIGEKTVAVIGYGAQGHAHALNLKDSGVQVIVGLRDDSPSTDKVMCAGFSIMSPADAVCAADVVMMLLPDEAQPDVYLRDVHAQMKAGAALGFAHGLNIHFGFITPRNDIDIFLVAPKGAGYGVRAEFIAGRGVPCLISVAQDVSGQAKDIALSYAAAIGGGRSGIIETSFREECETDLFGEQAVLCGGIPALIQAGFDTLVEAGYPPELAYFECVHETKLIVDLIYERGFAGMQSAISNTAEYGGYTRGRRVASESMRAEMKQILAEIRSGQFANEWMGGNGAGVAELPKMRAEHALNPIEKAGAFVRKLVFGNKSS